MFQLLFKRSGCKSPYLTGMALIMKPACINHTVPLGRECNPVRGSWGSDSFYHWNERSVRVVTGRMTTPDRVCLSIRELACINRAAPFGRVRNPVRGSWNTAFSSGLIRLIPLPCFERLPEFLKILLTSKRILLTYQSKFQRC